MQRSIRGGYGCNLASKIGAACRPSKRNAIVVTKIPAYGNRNIVAQLVADKICLECPDNIHKGHGAKHGGPASVTKPQALAASSGILSQVFISVPYRSLSGCGLEGFSSICADSSGPGATFVAARPPDVVHMTPWREGAP